MALVSGEREWSDRTAGDRLPHIRSGSLAYIQFVLQSTVQACRHHYRGIPSTCKMYINLRCWRFPHPFTTYSCAMGWHNFFIYFFTLNTNWGNLFHYFYFYYEIIKLMSLIHITFSLDEPLFCVCVCVRVEISSQFNYIFQPFTVLTKLQSFEFTFFVFISPLLLHSFNFAYSLS